MKHGLTLNQYSHGTMLHIVQFALRLKQEPEAFENIPRGLCGARSQLEIPKTRRINCPKPAPQMLSPRR